MYNPFVFFAVVARGSVDRVAAQSGERPHVTSIDVYRRRCLRARTCWLSGFSANHIPFDLGGDHACTMEQQPSVRRRKDGDSAHRGRVHSDAVAATKQRSIPRKLQAGRPSVYDLCGCS